MCPGSHLLHGKAVPDEAVDVADAIVPKSSGWEHLLNTARRLTSTFAPCDIVDE
jgi:hypothetical protein